MLACKTRQAIIMRTHRIIEPNGVLRFFVVAAAVVFSGCAVCIMIAAQIMLQCVCKCVLLAYIYIYIYVTYIYMRDASGTVVLQPAGPEPFCATYMRCAYAAHANGVGVYRNAH